MSWRNVTGWFAHYYDKLVLMVVLLLLAWSSLVLLQRIDHADRKASTADHALAVIQAQRAQDLDLSAWDAFMQRIEEPALVERSSTQLLVSDLRVACVVCSRPIPYAAEICTFTECRAEQPEAVDPQKLDSSGDGIPDWWKIQYGLDPYSTHDAFIDSDGDGFTNYEEFLHGTDPTDPTSFPPPAARLRLVEVVSHPFDLRFEAVQVMPDASHRYQINLREGERSHFVRMGDEVEGFTVVDYEENIEVVEGRRADRSVLTLSSPAGERIALTRGQTRTRRERSATLVFLIDGRAFENVRVDGTLELMGHTYKVRSVRPDMVRLQDVESEEVFPVPQLSDAERQSMRRGRVDERSGYEFDAGMDIEEGDDPMLRPPGVSPPPVRRR